MAVDATEAFFDELALRGHEPLLEKVTGSMRFDLSDGRMTRRWLVTVSKGDVSVSRRNAAADCVLRADRALFEHMAEGRVNPLAAVLRGAIEIEGKAELLVLFQRLFPAPPRTGRGRAREREPR